MELTYEQAYSKLEEILNSEHNPGIDRFNDLTGKTPLIKIYLQKKANPAFVLKYLYKKTSLQSYYPINFTMLGNGRFPRVFTWKEMLQAHLAHEKEVYTRSYQFDLAKIQKRLHIIEGLLKAISMIEEVIRTIKSSSSTAEANTALCKLFNETDYETKANGIYFRQEELPIYEVIESAIDDKELGIVAGTKLITNSQPTKLNVDGTMYYLVKKEYIAGIVES